MQPHDHVSVKEEYAKEVRESIKLLLETKHLYQYISVSLTEKINELLPNTLEYGALRKHAAESILGSWYIVRQGYNPQLPPSGVQKSGTPHLIVYAPRVRLYCAACRSLELHDCLHCDNSGTSFYLDYQCLNCNRTRIKFLVERERNQGGSRLRLGGRYPMEQAEAPKWLPRFLESYYSDALIACRCGFALMGNFGLRTLVEQWARSATGVITRIDGDKLLEQYGDILPPNFSYLYPSLRALYSDLSADIHRASGDLALFERGIEDIERHFTGLRSVSLPLNSGIASALTRKSVT